MKPKVLVLRAAGTNCEIETAYAFEVVGATPTILHVNRLREKPALLREHQVLAIPGGFSYGDDVASGRIFANELMSALRDELLAFVERGGFAIGICNGFQVLVKSGLLPRVGGGTTQQATLTDNTSGVYTDRWVRLTGDPKRCAWIPDDLEIELPWRTAKAASSPTRLCCPSWPRATRSPCVTVAAPIPTARPTTSPASATPPVASSA